MIFFTKIANAEWKTGKGTHAFTDDQTKSECKLNAYQKAKMDAFSKAGHETFSSKQMEICSDTGDVATCELHQQTLNYYEGAYIESIRKKVQKFYYFSHEPRIIFSQL